MSGQVYMYMARTTASILHSLYIILHIPPRGAPVEKLFERVVSYKQPGNWIGFRVLTLTLQPLPIAQWQLGYGI